MTVIHVALNEVPPALNMLAFSPPLPTSTQAIKRLLLRNHAFLFRENRDRKRVQVGSFGGRGKRGKAKVVY